MGNPRHAHARAACHNPLRNGKVSRDGKPFLKRAYINVFADKRERLVRGCGVKGKE